MECEIGKKKNMMTEWIKHVNNRTG